MWRTRRVAYPDLPRRNLRALAGFLGHSLHLERRALGHVRATAFIWRKLVAELAGKLWLSLPHHTHGTKAILLVFSICTMVDFAFGYIHKRTIPAGVIGVFGGLFSTAVALLFLKWTSKK